MEEEWCVSAYGMCSRISATQLGCGSVDRAMEAVLKFLPDRWALLERAAKVHADRTGNRALIESTVNAIAKVTVGSCSSPMEEGRGNRTATLREGMGGWGRCGPRRCRCGPGCRQRTTCTPPSLPRCFPPNRQCACACSLPVPPCVYSEGSCALRRTVGLLPYRWGSPWPAAAACRAARAAAGSPPVRLCLNASEAVLARVQRATPGRTQQRARL